MAAFRDSPGLYRGLFSGQREDRIDDVYFEMMSQLDKAGLDAYCSVNKDMLEFCNSDYWLRLIDNAGLAPLLPFRSFYSSLASFYLNIRVDACYIVVKGSYYGFADQDHRAFTDINLAYRSITKRLEAKALEIIEGQEEPTIDNYRIMILLNDVPIPHDEKHYYTIWTNDTDARSNTYLNPQILTYPKLADRDLVIIKNRVQFNRVTGKLLRTVEMLPMTVQSLNRGKEDIRVLLVNHDGPYLTLSIVNLPDKRHAKIYYNEPDTRKPIRVILIGTKQVGEQENGDYIVALTDTRYIDPIDLLFLLTESEDVIAKLRGIRASFYNLSQLPEILAAIA